MRPRPKPRTRIVTTQAAFPASWVRQAKFWPSTSRVDNVYGDRHLVSRIVGEEEPLEAVAA